MRYPIISTLLSILFWCALALVFVYENSRDFDDEISLEVDASIIDEVVRQSQKHRETPATKDNSGIIQTQNQDAFGTKSAEITARPLPQIPDELREYAFNSFAIARFYIDKNGDTKVELIQPSQSPRLNLLLLKSLRKWHFTPATKNGIAVDSTQDIRVDFKVE